MKKQSIKNWILFILIIGGIVYFNWDNYYDSYGKKFNKERDRLGLLPIPSDWITKDRGTKTKLWRPENMEEVIKGRFGKEVLVENGKVYMERDRIVNKETSKDEAIEITYQFEENPKFMYKYYEFRENTLFTEKQLTKMEFEEIAKEWEVNLN